MILDFKSPKKQIELFLNSYLSQKEKEFKNVSPLAPLVFKQLRNFVGKGKMVRGGLVYFTYDFFGSKPDELCLKIAAAMEIIHAALLIHDDIMDEDSLRRGEKTVYAFYQDWAKKQGIKNAQKLGVNLGICIGDIVIFLCFDLLSSIKNSTKNNQNLVNFLSNELVRVGFGQIQDVVSGSNTQKVTCESILNLYCYKTARYTFSLPLTLGSIALSKKSDLIKKLEKFGEHLGLIFQIKDDEIGMMGDVKEIGKPVGSDIREGKKTLYYFFLFQKCSIEEKKQLHTIFGNKNLSAKQLAYVRGLISKYKINELIDKQLLIQIKKAYDVVSKMKNNAKQNEMLAMLTDYNLNRSK
jgi:geranylgeranyl diphosphate synthase type I